MPATKSKKEKEQEVTEEVVDTVEDAQREEVPEELSLQQEAQALANDLDRISSDSYKESEYAFADRRKVLDIIANPDTPDASKTLKAIRKKYK